MILRLSILMLVFLGASLSVRGQGETRVLPRIGDEIDAGEISYFGLFPDIDDPHDAVVLRSDTGMLITVTSGEGSEVFALSNCESEVFARCLDAFERLRDAANASEILGQELQSPALQRCFASFMHKRLLMITPLGKREGKMRNVVLRDGTLVEGIPLAVSDSLIAFWTKAGRYDYRMLDSALVIVSLSDIDSVRGTFYTNKSGQGWLMGMLCTGAIMYWVSEEQRNVYDGPGGTGTTVIPFPLTLILSGAVSIIPGMVIASLGGDLLSALPFTEETSDDFLEDLRKSIMRDQTPPEVLYAMARTAVSKSSSVDEKKPVLASVPMEREMMDEVGVPDVEVGVAFLMNLYDVSARPFGILPGLWVGKEILLLRDAREHPLLALFPRAGYGLLHASAGINMLLHLGLRGELFLGFDYVWNRDDLGRYSSEFTTGGGWTKTPHFVEGDWRSSAFVTVGFGFPLAGCRVMLEVRGVLAPAISVRIHDKGPHDPWAQPADYDTAPKGYSGLGLSVAYPITF
ncbi:MAG: hypothetical protein WBQ23_05130 [Bacteroidota bacterium]